MTDTQKEQLESSFLFITRIAYESLSKLSHSPSVTFDHAELVVNFSWDTVNNDSEGGVELGVPFITYSAFDSMLNYKIKVNTHKYTESKSIERRGAKPVTGSLLVPVCCLVAHELAHVVIFHSEVTHRSASSKDHGDEWLNLYLELRGAMLNAFERAGNNAADSEKIMAGLPINVKEKILGNVDRISLDGEVYGLSGAIEFFIEESMQENKIDDFIPMINATKMILHTGF